MTIVASQDTRQTNAMNPGTTSIASMFKKPDGRTKRRAEVAKAAEEKEDIVNHEAEGGIKREAEETDKQDDSNKRRRK